MKRGTYGNIVGHIWHTPPPEIVEPGVINKRKRIAMKFLNIKPKFKKYRLQRKSSQRGGVIYE